MAADKSLVGQTRNRQPQIAEPLRGDAVEKQRRREKQKEEDGGAENHNDFTLAAGRRPAANEFILSPVAGLLPVVFDFDAADRDIGD